MPIKLLIMALLAASLSFAREAKNGDAPAVDSGALAANERTAGEIWALKELASFLLEKAIALDSGLAAAGDFTLPVSVVDLAESIRGLAKRLVEATSANGRSTKAEGERAPGGGIRPAAALAAGALPLGPMLPGSSRALLHEREQISPLESAVEFILKRKTRAERKRREALERNAAELRPNGQRILALANQILALLERQDLSIDEKKKLVNERAREIEELSERILKAARAEY